MVLFILSTSLYDFHGDDRLKMVAPIYIILKVEHRADRGGDLVHNPRQLLTHVIYMGA